jgi:hypothetical protein
METPAAVVAFGDQLEAVVAPYLDKPIDGDLIYEIQNKLTAAIPTDALWTLTDLKCTLIGSLSSVVIYIDAERRVNVELLS